jgi:integrase
MDRGDTEFVFGPFDPAALQERADKAWEAAELDRVTLHVMRHAFASYMIGAGVNIKALSTFMGHASIVVTMDRDGHILPGAEDEAAALMDAYIQRERSAIS